MRTMSRNSCDPQKFCYACLQLFALSKIRMNHHHLRRNLVPVLSSLVPRRPKKVRRCVLAISVIHSRFTRGDLNGKNWNKHKNSNAIFSNDMDTALFHISVIFRCDIYEKRCCCLETRLKSPCKDFSRVSVSDFHLPLVADKLLSCWYPQSSSAADYPERILALSEVDNDDDNHQGIPSADPKTPADW